MTKFRTHLLRHVAAGVAGIAAVSSAGAAETFRCPAHYPIRDSKPTQTADGWTAALGDPAPLYGADVFDGPPEAKGSLQPAASGKDGSTWKFDGDYPDGVWLQCSYGGGALTLTRRIQPPPSTCVARYPRLSKGRPESVTFECR